MKTYLELVNTVLVAMREAPVSDVTQSNYTRLVGELINDAKEQVEDAHDWAAQLQTFSISIIAYESKYSLTGYGQRGIIDSVVSLKNNNYLKLTKPFFLTTPIRTLLHLIVLESIVFSEIL